jgi:protein TonB
MMRSAGRTTLYVLSVGAHAVLGAFLGTIPPSKHRETVAISFMETKQAKPPTPAQLPPEPEPPPPPQAAPLRAKATPPPTKSDRPAVATGHAASPLDALPDFGLSLGGGSGVAMPAGELTAALPERALAKTLARTAPKITDDCNEPVVKPKALSRPTPAYTADARAAAVSGKVRVEIVVDERGQVSSVRLLDGLGHGLDEAALAAARSMTFDAAARCGKPVSATFRIGFSFSPSAT